jgi:hypothetical protein
MFRIYRMKNRENLAEFKCSRFCFINRWFPRHPVDPANPVILSIRVGYTSADSIAAAGAGKSAKSSRI